MGLMERWDRRNQDVLVEQNEDLKHDDWAVNSKASRRAIVAVAATAATAGVARSADALTSGTRMWLLIVVGNALIWALAFWRMRRI